MAIEIKVPALGESVTEATVGQWFKKPGEAVKVDEPLVELETDKVTVEVPAPVAGRAGRHQGAAGHDGRRRLRAGLHQGRRRRSGATGCAPQPAPASRSQPAQRRRRKPAPAGANGPRRNGDMPPAPAARKMMEEKGLSAADVQGSGRRGQVLKEDVMAAAARPAGPAASGRRRPRPSPMRRWRPRRCRRADARAVGAQRCRARGAREA